MKGSWLNILFKIFIGLVLLCPSTSFAQTTILKQYFDSTASSGANGNWTRANQLQNGGAARTWSDGEDNNNDGSELYIQGSSIGWGTGFDYCGNSDPPPTCGANGTSYSALFDVFDIQAGDYSWIESPVLNLAAYSGSCYTVNLSFYYCNNGSSSGSDPGNTSASLTVEFWNGASWVQITGSPFAPTATNAWYPVTVTVPSSCLINGTYMRFLATSDFEYYPVGVDQILLTYTSTAAAITTSPSPAINCGAGVVLTASGATTYTWHASGSIITTAGASITVNPIITTTYTVNETGGCGGSPTVVVTAGITPTLTVSPTSATESCNGSNVALSVSGTVGNTYTWAPNTSLTATTGTAVTASPTVTTTYTCTATSSTGCTASQTVVITAPTALSASITAHTNATAGGCYQNGSATVGVSGGTGTKTYSWSPSGYTGGSTATYSGLTAGTYTCTVTDANSCTATAIVTISGGTAVSASITASSNATSVGGTNGSATAAGANGTGPYTYSWTPTGYTGATTATYSSLPTGTYTCTVTDADGCTATTTVTIGVTVTYTYSASIQSFTVPSCVNTLTVTAVGAAGGAGKTTDVPGGNGASITGIVTVASGNVIEFVTGGEGGWDNAGHYGGGGGGASYVWNNTTSTALVVAGGGGGTSYAGTAGSAAGTTTTGGSGGGGAGTGGNDGGAGGAGWTANGSSSGTGGGNGGTGGLDKANNFTGGIGYSAAVNGGYGGGGGGGYDDGAGGGGYTGGAGGTGTGGAGGGGAGGSSYVNGTTGATSATNTGNGSVSISYVPLSPTVSFSAQTNNTCTLTAGKVTATAAGGTAPYTYSWSPSTGVTGPLTATPTTMASGTYTCTVTDNKGCTGTGIVTITGPTALLSATSSSVNISCFGQTGTVTASPANGVPGYTYSWNSAPVQTTATATGLAAGSYTCTVTDADGCTTTTHTTITGPAAALSASVTTHTNATGCYQNGVLTVTPAGGTSPYTYSWSPVGYTGATTATYSALVAGTYTCTVTDANNCTTTVSATITGGTPLTASITASTNPSGCATTDGTATATGVNGTTPYSYSWSPSAGVTGSNTATPTTMAAGTYTCTVTDHNGCVATATVVLTAPTGTNDNFSCATALSVQSTSTPTTVSGSNNAATLESHENIDCQGFGTTPSVKTTVWYSFNISAATGTGPFFINMYDQTGKNGSGGKREYYHGMSIWNTSVLPSSTCASCACAPMQCMDNEEVGYADYQSLAGGCSTNSTQQVQPAFTKYSIAVNNLTNGTYYIQVGYPESGDADAFQISVSTGLPAGYTLTNPLPATGLGQASAAATSDNVASSTGRSVTGSAIENPVSVPYVNLTGNSCSNGGNISECTSCPSHGTNSNCIPCYNALNSGINYSSSSAAYPAGYMPGGSSNIGSSSTTYQATATTAGMGTIQGGVVSSGYVTEYCYSFSTNSTSTEVTANLQVYATYLAYGNGSGSGASNCTYLSVGGNWSTVYWADWALYNSSMTSLYGCGNINNFSVTGLGCNNTYVLCMAVQSAYGMFIARDNTQNYTIYPWLGQDQCNPSTNLCTTVLPITLTSFQVEYEEAKGSVAIYWSVATQTNNKLFTVQKSINGIDWENVTTVPGAGTTSEFMYYDATDENPYAGVSYYRLKQTDFDGTNFYSAVQPINIPSKYTVTIFPNPTAGDMTLRYGTQSPDPVSITITDISGKTIQAYTINEVQQGINDYPIATSTLASGMYLIKISNAQKTFYQKFIKQ